MLSSNLNRFLLYGRKSTTDISASIGAQFQIISESLATHNINIDLIANRFSSTGSAYTSKKSLTDLIKVVKRNNIICISDISRLTRNAKYFGECLEKFLELNINIYVANLNRYFILHNTVDLKYFIKSIKVFETESKLKGDMAAINANRRKVLILHHNKNLPLNKIHDMKTGNVVDLSNTFYRNENTGYKRKIPNGFELSADCKKIVKISDKSHEEEEEEEEKIYGVNGQKFSNEEYNKYINILIKLLSTKGSNIIAIKYYLYYLSMFENTHPRLVNFKTFNIKIFLSVNHSFSKKNKFCGKLWKDTYENYVILPYALNKHEIDSTFSFFGIYENIRFKPWSLTNIESRLNNIENITIINIEGCPTLIDYSTNINMDILGHLDNLYI